MLCFKSKILAACISISWMNILLNLLYVTRQSWMALTTAVCEKMEGASTANLHNHSEMKCNNGSTLARSTSLFASPLPLSQFLLASVCPPVCPSLLSPPPFSPSVCLFLAKQTNARGLTWEEPSTLPWPLTKKKFSMTALSTLTVYASGAVQPDTLCSNPLPSHQNLPALALSACLSLLHSLTNKHTLSLSLQKQAHNTKQKQVHTHTHTCVYIYLYIYIYFFFFFFFFTPKG